MHVSATQISWYLLLPLLLLRWTTAGHVEFPSSCKINSTLRCAALRAIALRGFPSVSQVRALCLVISAQLGGADALAEPFSDAKPPCGGSPNMDMLTLLLQAAIALEHREAARLRGATRVRRPYGDWRIRLRHDLHIGAAAALNGDGICARLLCSGVAVTRSWLPSGDCAHPSATRGTCCWRSPMVPARPSIWTSPFPRCGR